MNVNKATIVGRITNDLELKTTPTGRSVLSFGVATNFVYKDQNGEKQEKTSFHNIVAWGKQGEVIAQYCVKGQEIFVEGRLETRSWDDQESGKKMYRTEIILENFQFGQKPNGSGNFSQDSQNNQSAKNEESKAPEKNNVDYPEEEINPEDIPF